MGMEFGMSRELRISWKGAKSNKFNQTLLLFLKIGSLRYYLNTQFLALESSNNITENQSEKRKLSNIHLYIEK